MYMVVLLLAISAHEAAHAWMSYKFGDDTARLLGRVTLNPVAHTDPIGTLLIPIVAFIVAALGGRFPLIGWGKPTPVNPLRWRKKDLANVMVSLAGILANLISATIGFVIFKVLLDDGISASISEGCGSRSGCYWNTSLIDEHLAGGVQSAAISASRRQQSAGNVFAREYAADPRRCSSSMAT